MVKPLRVATVFAALVITLSGCGGASGEGAKPGGEGIEAQIPLADNIDKNGQFSWGYTTEATSFDPHRGSSGFDQNWLFPIYDRLVYAAPSGDYEPMLATGWNLSDDGTEITFTLRENLKFSDGTTFDADAVKYSLDRARGDESTVKTELRSVTSVEVTGPMEVTLSLSGGAGSLLGSLADRAGMIVSPTAAKADTLGTSPVGVGAYKIKEVLPGDSATYERTENYWDPSAQNVKEMVFKIMTDDQTRLSALQTGELDMALLRQNQVDPAKSMGLNILSGESPTFYYFAMNTSMAPFDNPDVRKALNMAIDRDGIGNGLLAGFCTGQIQPWPSISFAYDDEIGSGLEQIPFDPVAAKKLLADSGYAEGFVFDATITNITGYTAVAEAVQAQFKEIGVTMNLQVLPSAQASQLFSIDKTVAATISGYSPTPDPQGVLDRLLLPGALPNPGNYTDPKVVDLAQKSSDAIDQNERADYFHDIAQAMIDTTPSAVPICMQHRTEGFSNKVSGLSIYPSGARDYRGVGVSEG